MQQAGEPIFVGEPLADPQPATAEPMCLQHEFGMSLSSVAPRLASAARALEPCRFRQRSCGEQGTRTATAAWHGGRRPVQKGGTAHG